MDMLNDMLHKFGSRAIARFFVTGGIRGILPQKMFIFGGYEPLFSALIMRCVSEKSTLNKCEKAGVFSAYKCLFLRSC